MSEEKVLVSNIQRFSLHDGPGIRTTVFLKGCTLKCPWCSNPENISREIQTYQTETGENRSYGEWFTVDSLYNQVVKDAIFYEKSGGITYSGGEPLMQARGLLPLVKRLHKEGFNQCVETALFVETERLRLLIPYIDCFYVDVKILDEEKCSRVLGGKINTYFENVKTLRKAGVKIIFRLPLIPEYTTDEENRKKILVFLKENNAQKVELLKGHNLGAKKYRFLGFKQYVVPDVSNEIIDWYVENLNKNGILTEVCNI
jgi:pyruvate formate lyase activating enzyme